MHLSNKSILLSANEAVSAGNNEEFLSYCTDDVKWEFVGDIILEGKDAVRQYMQETYINPPQFKVENLIEDGDYVSAIGQISLKDKDGNLIGYTYCDVWKLSNGKLSELKAFVIKK
jgi:ketosteroid isomerase-like protein